MTKGQWIEYSGSDEQIAEIMLATEWVYRNKKGYESNMLSSCGNSKDLKDELDEDNVTHYLICNPHPLRDMIKRWADTGQEVYVKCSKDLWGFKVDSEIKIVGDTMFFITTTPNWNIPNAEYSFTPFGEK